MSDPEIAIIVEQIEKANECALTLTKQFLEDKINYDSKFDDPIKEQLKELMQNFLKIKHQIGLQHQAISIVNDKYARMVDELTINDQNVEQIMSQLDVDKDFQNTFNDLVKYNPFQIGDNEIYNRFLQLVEEQSEQLNNEDIEMMEREFTIPIDPICKTEINIPIRNKNCNHFYDKENFLNLFNQYHVIKCPVTGCSNKKVKINDVEEDSRLKILIEKAKKEQNK